MSSSLSLRELVYFPRLKMDLEPCTFVEVLLDDSKDGYFVGCLCAKKPYFSRDGVGYVKMVQYDLVAERPLIKQSGYVVNVRLSPSYPDRLLRQVVGTSKIVEVAIDQVYAICFVFTPRQLQDPKYHFCGGMRHVYCLRYVLPATHGQPLINVDSSEEFKHVSFLDIRRPGNITDFSISTAEKIWRGFFFIYKNLQAILSRRLEKQGLHARCTRLLYFPCPEVVTYLLNIFGDCVVRRNGKMKKSYVMTTSALRRFRKYSSSSFRSTLLRFETPEQMKELSQYVIGVMGCYGVRQRPPTLKQSHGSSFSENLVANVVVPTDEIETPFRKHTMKPGIDLLFMETGHLKITARYGRYLHHINHQGHPSKCPSPILLDILSHFPEVRPSFPVEADGTDNSSSEPEDDEIEEDDASVMEVDAKKLENDEDLIEIGTYFRIARTESLFVITKVDDTTVRANVVTPGNDLTVEEGAAVSFRRDGPILHKGIIDYMS